MIFSILLVAALLASTEAFAPLERSLHANTRHHHASSRSRSSVHSATHLRSYLDSLGPAPDAIEEPPRFGSYLDSLGASPASASNADAAATTEPFLPKPSARGTIGSHVTSTPVTVSKKHPTLAGGISMADILKDAGSPAIISNGGIDDICAFDAASIFIKSRIARSGSISAEDIHDSIGKANEIVATIRHHFPGALGSSEVLRRVRGVLDGMGVENVLLSQSVCPDEINHEHGDITDLFIEEVGGGKVFHLGGLAGVPFTGKTGFGAYSAHVAQNGHCFVLQAPHIGMSDDLFLGKYSREGQASAGSACGAAVGAMCHCAANNAMPDLGAVTDDYQMNFLIHEISKRMGALSDIQDENTKQAELARQTSDIGRGMLDQILSTEFGDANAMLFVFTGIQINMPFDFEDYFQPLSFEVRKKDGSIVDLFGQAFGH